MTLLLLFNQNIAPDILASTWTGIKDPKDRLSSAHALIPVAQASIEALITHYEQGRGNGGPPLNEHTEALEALRGLHQALGDILKIVDSGKSIPTKAQREAVGYLGRAAEALKDDPLPFAVSALCMGVFTTLGFPNVGGWLGAAAMTIRKSADAG